MWHIREHERALEDDLTCSPAEMARHLDRLLQRLRVEVLAHGNIAEGEAAALGPAIASALSQPEALPEAELPTRHALRMPDGGRRGGGGGSVGGGGVVVDLEAATEEEKNSAVQVCIFAWYLLLVTRNVVVYQVPGM